MALIIVALLVAELAFFGGMFTGNTAFLLVSALACLALCVALVVPIFV